MKTILVVDDEKMILRLAEEAIKTYPEGYSVVTAQDGRQAIQVLNSSRVDLVITDLKMPVMDGYELLSYMSRNHRNIPTIVMTAFGSKEIAKQLKQKGVLHYVEKPFDLNVLKEKIAEVFTATSKGFIHGFGLANFLQAVEVEQKTTTLAVRHKSRMGYLHLYNGELIDAELEDLSGEKAALEILLWDDAGIEIQPLRIKKRKIKTALMQLLLESSRLKDEKKSDSTHVDELGEAIRMAEGHHYKEAQRIIADFLKNDPRNPLGWLWYSRIIGAFKSIESALNNAYKLAPKHPEIQEEIRKYRFAAKLVKSAQVRRCPFCWSPIEIKMAQCPYCKAYLYIHDQFFKSPRNANKTVLEQAVERYTKVLSREQNINAYYFLSLAHLNLEQWEQGLNLFNKTVTLAPDKPMFSEQLKKLLTYMASNRTVEPEKYREDIQTELKPEPLEEAERKKILVVEDSSTTRKVISITLTQRGYEIIEAKDGLEALSRLNDTKPDLILLDIILPKMDGYKILSIIKSNAMFKNIPVIMLTSRDSFMSKVKGKLAGSSAYLTKPFDPKELVETIEKYMVQ